MSTCWGNTLNVSAYRWKDPHAGPGMVGKHILSRTHEGKTRTLNVQLITHTTHTTLTTLTTHTTHTTKTTKTTPTTHTRQTTHTLNTTHNTHNSHITQKTYTTHSTHITHSYTSHSTHTQHTHYSPNTAPTLENSRGLFHSFITVYRYIYDRPVGAFY